MKIFLKWLFLLPLFVIGAAIALANRQDATIYFDPFPNGGANAPQLSVTTPFWLILFATLMIGVLIGGVATWFGQGTHRRAARRARAELRRLNAARARQNLHPAIEHRKGA
ncbi:MAG: lipopolysaccharide assembly protein LapA domain-containing protein [Methylocella sp.]